MKTSMFAAFAAIAALTATGANAQTVLKFGHVGNPGSLFEITANEFARCVNEGAGGAVDVQIFGSSQLGNDQELLQKLKLNQVAFSLPSSVMSSVSDTFGVFEMPYIIKDRDHIKRVSQDMGDVFQGAAEANGYRIVGWVENGFRNITNNTRPINTPEDLQGVKLRTPRGEWRLKMFQAYGANPTPMAFSDVFQALQTGVIDGQENPMAQIWSAKFQEVQKYLSLTGHVYTPGYLLTSKAQYDGWPDDVKSVIDNCGASTQDFVYATAQDLDADLIAKVEAAGTAVNEANKQAFIDASTAIYDEFASTVDGGPELIEKIQALAAGS